MLFGALGGCIAAWFLTLFGFDNMFIETASQFGLALTTTAYYTIFVLVGAIGGALRSNVNNFD